MPAKEYVLRLEGHKAGRPWVARLTGLDPRYGLKRDFINAYHSEYDSKRRLVYAIWKLGDGNYEYEEHGSWTNVRRRYFVVKDGEVTQITGLEMKRRLEAPPPPVPQIPEIKPTPKRDKTKVERVLKELNGMRLKHGYKLTERKRNKKKQK